VRRRLRAVLVLLVIAVGLRTVCTGTYCIYSHQRPINRPLTLSYPRFLFLYRCYCSDGQRRRRRWRLSVSALPPGVPGQISCWNASSISVDLLVSRGAISSFCLEPWQMAIEDMGGPVHGFAGIPSPCKRSSSKVQARQGQRNKVPWASLSHKEPSILSATYVFGPMARVIGIGKAWPWLAAYNEMSFHTRLRLA
jgi:hypothetical protein